MFSFLSRLARWSKYRYLRKNRIPERLWVRVSKELPVISLLSTEEKHKLRYLSSLFLHEKVIVGEGGFDVDDYVRVVISAQACLLILNLSLDYFDGWSEVIVYPAPFVVNSSLPDETGVVHQESNVLGGEAWGRGPVILSWEDVRPSRSGQLNHGVNVVLHEFAHKIDLVNGAANGMPPLHIQMNRERWTEDFTRAYNKMLHHVEGGHRGKIDPYAVKSPAEFFAVVTEFFFERPHVLQQELPAIYSQLVLFYRQDPVLRYGR